MRQVKQVKERGTGVARSFRKRLEKSETLAGLVGAGLGRYLSLSTKTTTWQYEGMDDLKAALAEGPVLVLTWHSRLIGGSLLWPTDVAPLATLFNDSPIGRVAGAVQRRVGLFPMQMSGRTSNRSASRMILRSIKDGYSIALAGDGPKGPAHVLQDAPLEWARATGLPIFCYAFSTTRGRRANSWDQMLVPRPNGKGMSIFRRFDQEVPRRFTDEIREKLRGDLCAFLDETTADADRALGLEPGP